MWGCVSWVLGVWLCVGVVVCGGVVYVWVCGYGILNLVRLRRRKNVACIVLVVGHVVSIVFRPIRIVGSSSIWIHLLCVLWKVWRVSIWQCVHKIFGNPSVYGR